MDRRGGRIIDDSFLLLFNAHDEALDFVLPPEEFAPGWNCVVDTAGLGESPETTPASETVTVAAKGMVVLQALDVSTPPPVRTAAAAAVPAVPPVPVPTAPAYEDEPTEQSVVEPETHEPVAPEPEAPPAEPAPAEPAPAEPAPRRRRATTPRRSTKSASQQPISGDTESS
jgi:glycogen operon protein